MTLNDFKSIEGDRRMGILQHPRAARRGQCRAGLACCVMALPQLAVAALLLGWGRPMHGAAVLALLIAQLVLMRRLLDATAPACALVQCHRHHALCARACCVSAFAVSSGLERP